MEGEVGTSGFVRIRGSVVTPNLGMSSWAELEISRDSIAVRQRFPWSRWRTVRAGERVDLHRVTRVGAVGLGFVRGGDLRGWLFWNLRGATVFDVLDEAGWHVGPTLTMDDFRALAW